MSKPTCPRCGHPMMVHGSKGGCPTPYEIGIYEADGELHVDAETLRIVAKRVDDALAAAIAKATGGHHEQRR